MNDRDLSAVSLIAQPDYARVECSWDEAASLLCDSVVSSMRNFEAAQIFRVFHADLGPFEIVLSCAAGCMIEGYVDEQKLRTLLGKPERYDFMMSVIESPGSSGGGSASTGTGVVLRLVG